MSGSQGLCESGSHSYPQENQDAPSRKDKGYWVGEKKKKKNECNTRGISKEQLRITAVVM
jgi:hypothetical protein